MSSGRRSTSTAADATSSSPTTNARRPSPSRSPGSPSCVTGCTSGWSDSTATKMSKSLGNLVFVGDLLKEWEPAVVRLALLAHHYRPDWEWTDEDLPSAARRLEAWRAAARFRCAPRRRRPRERGPGSTAVRSRPRRRSGHPGGAWPLSMPRPPPAGRSGQQLRSWALACRSRVAAGGCRAESDGHSSKWAGRSLGPGGGASEGMSCSGRRTSPAAGNPFRQPPEPAPQTHHPTDTIEKAAPLMAAVTVRLPDGSTKELDAGTTARQLAESIGPRLAKAAVAATVDGPAGRPRRRRCPTGPRCR